jgi:hypothetical protein
MRLTGHAAEDHVAAEPDQPAAREKGGRR